MAAKSIPHSSIELRFPIPGDASIDAGIPAAASVECPVCAHPNPPGARFCSDCGSRVDLAGCPYCEAINSLDSAFCYKCNAPLTGRTSAERDVPSSRGAAAWHEPSADGPVGDPADPMGRGAMIDDGELARRRDVPDPAATADAPRQDLVTPPSPIALLAEGHGMVVSPGTDDVARETAGPAAASVAPDDLPLASQGAAPPESAPGALVAPGLLERAIAKTETPHATAGKRWGLRLGLLAGTLAVAAGVWVAQDRTLLESWMARVLPATTTDATPQPPANEASGTIQVESSTPQVPSARAPTGPDTAPAPFAVGSAAPVAAGGKAEPTPAAVNAVAAPDRVPENVPPPLAAPPVDSQAASERSSPAAPEPPLHPTAAITPPHAAQAKAAPAAKRSPPVPRPSARTSAAPVPNARAVTIRATRGSPAGAAVSAASGTDSGGARAPAPESALPRGGEGPGYGGPPIRCTDAVAALGLCQ